MSSSTIAASPVNVTETKTRKPTLPEKYGKFIQFAYYMMDNIIGMDDLLDDDEERKKVREAYFEKIKLFGNVEDQQAMIQGFLDNSKENKKTIRKEIADRKKAVAKEQKDIAKALAKENKPARQPRAKKTNEDGTEPAVKKSRKKVSNEVNNVQDELLNDLVSLARDEKPVETVIKSDSSQNEE